MPFPKGGIHTEEARKKMALSRTGLKPSEETKKKLSLSKIGPKNPKWKNGRYKDADGYIRVSCRTHPYAHDDGHILEHRLVMEVHLGRTLLPSEVVHHINGVRDDNRIENLMLFSTDSKHQIFHGKENKHESLRS